MQYGRRMGLLRDKQVVQPPNTPIITAAAAAIPAFLWPNSLVGQVARAVMLAALLVWAALELFDGANWIRRVMGGTVALLVLASAVMWLKAL